MTGTSAPIESSLAQDLATEVRCLQDLDLQTLRSEWRRRLGTPPQTRSAELLRFILAWHIQADVFGGLDADLRKRLRGSTRSMPPAFSAGAKLVREWQGERHEVLVEAEGFVYRGKRYGRLSSIARAITGSRWNGPRFFGLRGREEEL